MDRLAKLFLSLSDKERKVLIVALAVFVVAAVIWGVRFYYHSTVEKPVEGGRFTEGMVGQPVAINPLIAANDVDRDLVELLFAGLMDLVEEHQASDDKKIWTFTLKKDLQWSDGQPLTSDDVLFTLESIKDPATRSSLSSVWQGVVGERLSELRFRLILRTPYVFFEDNLSDLKIVPSHIFENIPSANLRLSGYNLEPVSSGPYKFSAYHKRKDGFISDYRFEINDNYAGDRPYISNFNIRFYPDKNAMIDAFNSREIDGLSGLGPADAARLRVAHNLRNITVPGYYAVFINPALNPALKDKDVRQALTYATDRQALVAEVFGGKAAPVLGPIFPTVKGYSEDIYKNLIFSNEKSSELLDKAGWKKEDDGIRSKIVEKKKTRLEFDLIVPDVEFLVKTAEILKQHWLTIGIAINLVIIRPQEVSNDIIKTRNYQLLLFGILAKNNPDIYFFWHSSERFAPGGNLSLFANKSVDNLLESVKTDFDPDSRDKSLEKIQTIISQENPAVFLYSIPYLYASTQKLKGFDGEFLATRSQRFNSTNRWYLKTQRALR